MADQPPEPRDEFLEYFTEKLWQLIPGIYRHEDGLADSPGVLRALVDILAEQAVVLRRSNDRLWEDQFIDLCDDWAVPYIGDLVATRLVAALNKRGRRVDVAKTIYYRRRKGTLRVLEELIADIAGWEGTVREAFRRLARTHHGLDPQPGTLAGPLTGTPPGGWADLRRQVASELADGPFDEYHHTADVRRQRGRDGRYAIPKLALHLYRLSALRVEGVTPHARAGGLGFTFDPSGRDVPLFMPRNRRQDANTAAGRSADWDAWRPAREWELPAPMRCRVLGHAEYVIDEALVQQLVAQGLAGGAADDLRTLRDVHFANEGRLRETLAALANGAALLAPGIYNSLLAGALVDDCGKHALLPNAVEVEQAPGSAVPPERIAAGSLASWTANAPGKRLVIDPQVGRFLFIGAPPAAQSSVTYHYGFPGEIGAGTCDRREVERRKPDVTLQGGGAITAAALKNKGVTQINDSATYGPLSDKLQVRDLTLQAANQQRPYIVLQTNWVLNTGIHQESEVLLDGLWLGSDGNHAVILRGEYQRVTIRNCTLDPGGTDADGNPIRAVPLAVEAQVEELIISDSIMGPIYTQAGGVVQTLRVEDTIVQATAPGVAAVALPAGEAHLSGVTVLGPLRVDRLWASETLVTEHAEVTDTQRGCFRFSAAQKGSRLPRPYESHFLADWSHIFTSRRFGHPGYAQMSETAPVELCRGAENGSEIGAYSSLLNPIKLDSLQAKVAEYLPFGLIPLYLFET